MATVIGYSSVGRYKNYTLTDFELIKADLLNALNIRQGEVPGRPDVGTSMWSLMFEPQTLKHHKQLLQKYNELWHKIQEYKYQI